MSKVSDLDQWELDQEVPLPEDKKFQSRFMKTKVVLLDNSPDDPEIEIGLNNGGGLNFRFTTKEEYTTEEIEECDLGHKHRKIVTKDHSFETVSISRRDAKALLLWLKARVR